MQGNRSFFVLLFGWILVLVAIGNGGAGIARARDAGPETLPAGQWYRGDLHSHSLYSDGDSSVAEVLASVEDRGLDFFTLTDHDTSLDGIPSHWDDPDYLSATTVLLYGIEWTTGPGHANLWAAAPFDYTGIWQANAAEDAAAAATEAHAGGALFSINHPMARFTQPWQYDVGTEIDSIEVWNSMYRLPNANALASHSFWDGFLNQGRRIPGVGGSDTHRLTGILARLYSHGNPTTWVFARYRTAEAILEGIKAGRVAISYAPGAERLEFSADGDGDGILDTIMGETIATPPARLDFQVTIVPMADEADSGSPPRVRALTRTEVDGLARRDTGRSEVFQYFVDSAARALVIFRNGRPWRIWEVPGEINGPLAITFSDRPPPGQRRYYRAEFFGNPDLSLDIQSLLYGNFLALTNPIYVGFGEE